MSNACLYIDAKVFYHARLSLMCHMSPIFVTWFQAQITYIRRLHQHIPLDVDQLTQLSIPQHLIPSHQPALEYLRSARKKES